jgi:hypothetical protein
MSKSASEKTLWEYVLLAISGFATLVQLLGLVSQSQALFAQPSVTTTFVIVVLVGTAVGSVFVLLRTKPGTFTAKIPYYTDRQRLIVRAQDIGNKKGSRHRKHFSSSQAHDIGYNRQKLAEKRAFFATQWRKCVRCIEPWLSYHNVKNWVRCCEP